MSYFARCFLTPFPWYERPRFILIRNRRQGYRKDAAPNGRRYFPHVACSWFIHSCNFYLLVSFSNIKLSYIFKAVISCLYDVMLSFCVLAINEHQLFINIWSEFEATLRNVYGRFPFFRRIFTRLTLSGHVTQQILRMHLATTPLLHTPWWRVQAELCLYHIPL